MLKNSRLEGAHAMFFVKPLKEVLAGRKIGENKNISKPMLEESVMAMNDELHLIRKLHDDQQDSLNNAVSLSEESLNEVIPLNVDYSKMINNFMIDTPSFLGKRYTPKKNSFVGDGDKVVANHFNNVDKLIQIVQKLNETLADKIQMIEDHCNKQDAQLNQIKQLENELRKIQQIQTTESDGNQKQACDKSNFDLTESFENVENESPNVRTIDGATTDREAKKPVETSMNAPKVNQDNTSVDLISDNDVGKVDKSTKTSNEDEISKIQKLEKEMSELKNSLQESQCQDGILKRLYIHSYIKTKVLISNPLQSWKERMIL